MIIQSKESESVKQLLFLWNQSLKSILEVNPSKNVAIMVWVTTHKMWIITMETDCNSMDPPPSPSPEQFHRYTDMPLTNLSLKDKVECFLLFLSDSLVFAELCQIKRSTRIHAESIAKLFIFIKNFINLQLCLVDVLSQFFNLPTTQFQITSKIKQYLSIFKRYFPFPWDQCSFVYIAAIFQNLLLNWKSKSSDHCFPPHSL